MVKSRKYRPNSHVVFLILSRYSISDSLNISERAAVPYLRVVTLFHGIYKYDKYLTIFHFTSQEYFMKYFPKLFYLVFHNISHDIYQFIM